MAETRRIDVEIEPPEEASDWYALFQSALARTVQQMAPWVSTTVVLGVFLFAVAEVVRYLGRFGAVGVIGAALLIIGGSVFLALLAMNIDTARRK